MIVDPKVTEYDVVCMVACSQGIATGEQAKHAMEWIMREACRWPSNPYIDAAGNVNDTLIAEGRRLVGEYMRRMLDPRMIKTKVSGGGKGIDARLAENIVVHEEARAAERGNTNGRPGSSQSARQSPSKPARKPSRKSARKSSG